MHVHVEKVKVLIFEDNVSIIVAVTVLPRPYDRRVEGVHAAQTPLCVRVGHITRSSEKVLVTLNVQTRDRS
jgi:hypothetical protein